MLEQEERKRQKQREADARYRLRHPEKQKAKDRKRYIENKEHEKARNSSYYMRNREVQRIKHRNTKHHMTSEWYDAKMAEQESRCAVCKQIFLKTPHIDHDHKCCKPSTSCEKCRRGFLCDDCNLGLGRFKDSIEVLQNAIQYLKEYSNEC